MIRNAAGIMMKMILMMILSGAKAASICKNTS